MFNKLAKVSLALVAIAIVNPASATILLSENFSTFANGNLAGQNGWAQYGVPTTAPIQVVGGSVVLPGIPTGGAANDAQDVSKEITPIPQPAVGTTTFYVGLNLVINSAPTAGSYFFATNQPPTPFQNVRLTARSSGTGYQIGSRVNGQGGYPFAYGSVLAFGQSINLVAEVNSNAGNANDTIRLFVNPTSNDLAQQVAYAVAGYSTGTVNDPSTYTSVILSQFANAGTGQAGVSFQQLRVATTFGEAANISAVTVPEANTFALAGLGVLALAVVAIRRRKVA